MTRMVSLILLGYCVGMSAASSASAQDAGKLPTEGEVKALLQKEPIDEASWPTWKQRLTDWFGDMSRQTDPAYQEAGRFVGRLADPAGRLPARFDQDKLAWYFLGGYYLDRKPIRPDDLSRAESAYRRSIAIAPGFGRGHRNLALALALQVKPQQPEPNRFPKPAPDVRLGEAEGELQAAARLDPSLQLAGYHGMIEQQRGNLPAARAFFADALRKDPQNVGWATQFVQCLLFDTQVRERASSIKPLVDRFPQDGVLATFFALGLALDNRPGEAYTQLQRARSLGVEPSTILSAAVVNRIEDAGRPGLTEWYLWIMMWFGLSYAAVMVVMAGVGVLLALWTRGTGALDLLRAQAPEQLVTDGRIARVHGETVLARLYGLALMLGLCLFYAAIPFVIIGLLGGTALLLYLIFTSLDRIPIKLILIIFVAGAFSAWSVFKSIFTRPAPGGFGIPKTSEQSPRLHELLAEVAQRVDTDAVNEIFLSPGAAIGVHQEGRGPFGMFGINKRVLTLGFCTLRFLTIGELKAILAHEYAHFSHSDTFYSRFIYQVHMSIEEALYGMMGAGGIITYINPFYWFLWLYYKSYSLLAAGYSRSREFLADRMAATLYGAAPFTNALTKVSTDGTLFEMTIYDHIASLLNERKEYVNMYEAFAHFRNEQMTREDREKLYQNLLGEQGSLFASHPTFAERAKAIQSLPAVAQTDDRPALSLFDEPDALEQELTRFLTDYMAYLQHLQAQAAQQKA